MIFLKNLRIDKKLLKELDFTLIITIILVVLLGIVNIYSITYKNGGFRYAKLQFLWLLIGLAIMYIIISFDYKILSKYIGLFYWACVIILLLNDVLGRSVKGAKAMITLGQNTFAPSEFAKLALIFMLAKKIEEMDYDINKFKHLAFLALYSVIPTVLILMQPALGMAIVCFSMVLGILYLAQINLKILLSGLLAVIVSFILIWNTNLIPAYQKSRVSALLNPDQDITGMNLQVNNSEVAIGSGGMLGKGLENSDISSTVPENSTDFIFSALGEHYGFTGEIILLVLYGVVIWRIVLIARNSKDRFGSLICIGIVSAFLFSILQNIGMTIGIMPVSGIALPFVSRGGSSMVSYFIGIGLVLNVGMRKKSINF
jgi:rod shape determining protein RodA